MYEFLQIHSIKITEAIFLACICLYFVGANNRTKIRRLAIRPRFITEKSLLSLSEFSCLSCLLKLLEL